MPSHAVNCPKLRIQSSARRFVWIWACQAEISATFNHASFTWIGGPYGQRSVFCLRSRPWFWNVIGIFMLLFSLHAYFFIYLTRAHQGTIWSPRWIIPNPADQREAYVLKFVLPPHRRTIWSLGIRLLLFFSNQLSWCHIKRAQTGLCQRPTNQPWFSQHRHLCFHKRKHECIWMHNFVHFEPRKCND